MRLRATRMRWGRSRVMLDFHRDHLSVGVKCQQRRQSELGPGRDHKQQHRRDGLLHHCLQIGRLEHTADVIDITGSSDFVAAKF